MCVYVCACACACACVCVCVCVCVCRGVRLTSWLIDYQELAMRKRNVSHCLVS